jgi:hypothetical protein
MVECLTKIHSHKNKLNRQIGKVCAHSMKVSLEDLYNETSNCFYCSLNSKEKDQSLVLNEMQ